MNSGRACRFLDERYKMIGRDLEKAVDQCLRDPPYSHGHLDVREITRHLQESDPKYRRLKRQVLMNLVSRVLQAKISQRTTDTNSMNRYLHQLYQCHDTSRENGVEATEMNNMPRKSVSEDKVCENIPPVVQSKERKRTRKKIMKEDGGWGVRDMTAPSVAPEKILPPFNLSSLGGVDKIVQEVRNVVIRPLRHPEAYKHVGVYPPRGILIHGPPGSGKTKLALAVAGEAQVPFFKVSAPELIQGLSGESEQNIRELFFEAKQHSPSLIFIDEIDILCPKRETASREMERRIVAQLGTCMDDLLGSFVIVMGATNRADALDPMIRRNGRFDKEIAMGLPDEEARIYILKSITSNLRLDSTVDFKYLGKLTPGFVGADLESVVKEAGLVCIDRMFSKDMVERKDDDGMNESQMSLEAPQFENFAVTQKDFIEAVSRVQPSAKREGFATCPDVSWDNVGGLNSQRKELEDQICHPIREARLYEQLGISVPGGVLLYGPPGCGKTLLAKAVACESRANFISVKGPELLNKYLGESERAIRQVFQRARMSSPCIIFFDELDSLCAKRGSDTHSASERVVNQLLTEMDGVENRHHVFVVAATNRPELIDPAMLRPGRLDRLVYVPLPDTEKRADILKRLCHKTPIHPNVDLNYVATLLEGFSGADLSAVLRQAVMFLLEEIRKAPCSDELQPRLQVQMCHLLKAVSTVKPSVTKEHRLHYETMYRKIAV